MRIMVLGGAGAVASETTRDLVYNSSADEVLVVDADLAKAERLTVELQENCKKGFIPEAYRCDANSADFQKRKISFLRVDASDVNALTSVFREVDAVACGLPFKYDLQVTEAAVNAGINAVDLSFAKEQMGFDARAKEVGTTYIPGVGATPGITNVMARLGMDYLDQVDEVHIYFAAFRCLAPAPGLLYTTFWEFDPDEKTRCYYEDGRLVPVPPLTGGKKVRFHDLIGEHDVFFVPHPETFTLGDSIPGVRRIDVRGTFPPHVMRLVSALLEAGFFSHNEVEVWRRKVSPFEAIQDLLLQLPESGQSPIWAYGLVVEVIGRKDDRPTKCVYSNSHPPQDVWGGKAAYFKNVGIPLAIAAEMLAKGEIRVKGVVPPERALDPRLFIERLALRKIQVSEQVLEVGC